MATEEMVDLSDLDLLDDLDIHFFCKRCNPARPGLGVAVCGRRAFARGGDITRDDWENGCQGCISRAHEPCLACGSVFFR